VAEHDYENLFLRGEVTNFWCFAISLARPTFWLDNPVFAYATTFICIQKPRVVITFVDNNYHFYRLKNKFPNITFISVQNGFRDLADEFFVQVSELPLASCDFLFCFGKGIAAIYKKHISCDAISHGSVRNNLVERCHLPDPSHAITFVSNWAPASSSSDIFLTYPDKTQILWSEFFSYEENLLQLCSSWCENKSKKLLIVGRYRDKKLAELEFQYYSERLNGSSWLFQKPSTWSSSYNAIDRSRICVGTDSTLLFEGLARGCRVAIFAARKFLDFNHRPFNYSDPEQGKGTFWSDEVNQSEFERVLSYLDEVSDSEWEAERLVYLDQVMNFDIGNRVFGDTLRGILEKEGKQLRR
jgi:surface carbohydrate biosynthesis protein